MNNPVLEKSAEPELVRCFVALDISREAIKEIEGVQNLIKKKNLFYGKFTELENLHITLKFLGEIPPEKVEEVNKKLNEIRYKELEASFDRLEFFNKRMSKSLLIRMEGKGIWELQQLVEGALKGLFEPKERFMAHITIARVKNIPDKKSFSDYINGFRIKKIKFIAKEFFLKKSELKPEGPIYSNLEKYALK